MAGFDAIESSGFNASVASGYDARGIADPGDLCILHSRVLLQISGVNSGRCSGWSSLSVDGTYILYKNITAFGACGYGLPIPESHEIVIGGVLSGETFKISIGGNVIVSHTDTTGIIQDTRIALSLGWNASVDPLASTITASGKSGTADTISLVGDQPAEPFGGLVTINSPGGEALYSHSKVENPEPNTKTYATLTATGGKYQSLKAQLIVSRLGSPPADNILNLTMDLIDPDIGTPNTAPLFFSNPIIKANFGEPMDNELACTGDNASSSGQAIATFLGI